MFTAVVKLEAITAQSSGNRNAWKQTSVWDIFGGIASTGLASTGLARGELLMHFLKVAFSHANILLLMKLPEKEHVRQW